MNSIDQIEDQIIEDAISGDKQAFGILYERYFKQIFRYLLIRSNDRYDAEDMTETVFLKAWTHLPGFGRKSGSVNFRAWLYRIAHNTVVDHYRTKKLTVSLDDEEISIEHGPGQLFIENEEKRKLVTAIKKLDDVSQDVIACRFFSGLSHKETALAIGLSENNVRVIQYRALKKVREMLRDDENQ